MQPLTGAIQNYAWGSTTAIPQILGVEPDGQPQAELWLGAHPAAPSQVDGRPLPELITEDPAILGSASVDQFGPRLSYLMKILAADQALSLQAHPSRAQAEEGFAREDAAGIARDAKNRNYVDDWPKPEALCALGDFEALYGFADPEVTNRLAAALALPMLDQLFAPLTAVGGAEGIKQVFVACCELPDEQRVVVDDLVQAAFPHIGDENELGTFCRTAIELAAVYPRDPGVLAALLMNRVRLREHEAIFLPAGNMHAYLRGTGVEIMANSNNVLRGGLTPKHVDVAELSRLVDFTPITPPKVAAVEGPPGVWRYDTPAPEFALWRLELANELAVPGSDRGRIVLVTSGSARCGDLHLSAGQSGWLAAGEEATLTGEGRVFVGGSGVPAVN
ncbi:mannose-6-phosphate isomerase, class I [Propionibacteriaceae bacterium Y1700]|uniref:mannose-6-phosphate isomerase, class I n=1 Tax=Microlunatus sp. Y1700 TaxID=3418487 RepID=UPI003DA7459A